MNLLLEAEALIGPLTSLAEIKDISLLVMKRTGKIARLTVESSSNDDNRVDDPAELATILRSSLRHLFGDLESHSFNLQVVIDERKDKSSTFVVSCLEDSAQAVRAALTWVTPPPYLEMNLYRFDVLSTAIVKNTEFLNRR